MSLLTEMLRKTDNDTRRYIASSVPTCVDANAPISQYVDRHINGWFDWESALNEIPVIVPPWNNCWIEYRHMWQEDSHPNAITKYGVHIVSTRVTQEKLDRYHSAVEQKLTRGGLLIENLQSVWSGVGRWLDAEYKYTQDRPNLPGWIIMFEVYAQSVSGRIGYIESMVWILDEKGKMYAITEPVDFTYENRDSEMQHITLVIFPVLFAVSLMHCKNVKIVDAPPTPPKVAASRAKKGIPDIKYKTLVIEPMRKQIRRESAEDDESISEVHRALHICRGHFKDYRENPLFGKHADIYWWEPHVRGNAQNGTIIKDYKVNAPRE